jgi:hypothetical protein
LSLAQFQPSPCRARTGRKNSGRSAKRLACRARVLLAKVPIALKRAVGLSGPSSSRQSAPILQQWSEQVCRSFEAGQAMSHSDANCAKPRTGFRSRPADPWKLGARSLPEQQPPPARAPGGPFLIESAILSFPLQPLRPHNARTRARGRATVEAAACLEPMSDARSEDRYGAHASVEQEIAHRNPPCATLSRATMQTTPPCREVGTRPMGRASGSVSQRNGGVRGTLAFNT